MKRRRIRAFVLLLVLGALAGAFFSDRFWFAWPEKGVATAERMIRRHLERRHQVAFLMTFDEPGAHEWVSRKNGISVGVDAVPGRFGWGRLFSGTRWSTIQLPVGWGSLKANQTISMWIKLEPPADLQDILFTSAWGRQAGLRIEGGNLTLYVPKRETEEQKISYPFTRWNEFVQIVAVTDAEAGQARLYENGQLMAEGPISDVNLPRHNIQFGGSRWYSVRAPLHAVLDETIIWNRALAAPEIKRLARARQPSLSLLAPFQFRLWQGAKGWAAGARRALKYIDYFDPRVLHGQSRAADFPEINLIMSKRDQRHFNQSHFQSWQSGRRTAAAAAFRHIDLIVNGKALPGELALDGNDTTYGDSPRRSFLLETEAPVWNGLRQIRLAPPETVDWIAPLVDTRIASALNLKAVPNGLCRLLINGRFEGIYYYEDDAHRGVDPNAGAAFMRGPDQPMDWAFVFKTPFPETVPPRGPPRNGIPLTAEQLQALFDKLVAEVSPLLGKDVRAPFSRRELAYRLRDMRNRLTTRWVPGPGRSRAHDAAEYLTPFMVLGGNPAPLYIREDLDLGIFASNHLSVAWSSSNPDVLDAAGHVRLPKGDLPVGVTLTARMDDGTTLAERQMEFRVMPRKPRIPALMIYVNAPLQKSRRVDCRIERYGDSPFDPTRYRAFQGKRGGIKFRGNTSFWQTNQRPPGTDSALRKMSLSIRFEDAHRLLNDTETKHLYLGNGYIDITLLHDRLAWDLYHAASAPGSPRFAPDLEWSEVFVNGQYQGMYGCGTRIDRHLLGWDREEPGQDEGSVLYKFVGAGDNFGHPNTDGLAQKFPAREQGLRLDPYLRLVDFVHSAPRDSFVEQVEQRVDVDAVMDWQLLLNLTENTEGSHANVFLAANRAAGNRLFFIPWDYDKTFAPGGPEWFSNALTSRLWRDYPDYRQRLLARWKDLRAGPWSEAAILGMIERAERHLEGYLAWDYKQWDIRYARGRTLADEVDSARTRALDRLAFLDQFLVDKISADKEEADVDANSGGEEGP
jgi:hypothetical protein